MNDPLPERFSDEKAKAILARAIELDSRAPVTTADDLRAIAADLGVSPASLDAALREQSAPLPAGAERSGESAASRVAGLGLPLGASVGWLFAFDSSAGILAALGATAVGLVASAAGTRLPFWLRVARRVAGWLPRPQQRAASRGRGPLPAPQELAL